MSPLRSARSAAGTIAHRALTAYAERQPGHGAEGTVTVHSQGGLGNQLFIYAAGLSAARAAGAELRVDVGLHRERDDRPWLLDSLGLPAEVVDLGYAEHPGAGLLEKFRAAPRACSYREPAFSFDQQALAQPAGSCLFGYFQSWRYVEPVSEQMHAHFRRLAEHRAERLAAVDIDPGAVVVHVRRGDYLAAAGYHGLAGAQYYREAVGLLRRCGFSGPLLLLSDDLPLALEELSDLGELVPLAQPGMDAVDELLLMRAAPALVTANSSFSWWGGWSGQRPGRPVVSPRPWFDEPTVSDRDLLPPSWLTLDRRTFSGR
ncbi:glycosyl transferase family 11 [Motilibacter peucedani]|uniref:Glycosyl transferase family 11 n=1 Tax=Motilibacter peucedani TaxID=598650 RepID=A0A420XTZ5_9ACTN|nr:alpha-1,2-fucosyltransferase [Motilibacter peucedani]RKS80305.1 glycosyl transferase family 11 [Motilibacter peucedani]